MDAGSSRLCLSRMAECPSGFKGRSLSLTFVLGLCAFAVLVGGCYGESGERPNLILYVVDTLRADYLGVYGYDAPISPKIDAFAARATVFERAVAESPWTRPSIASLFTGLLPHQHGTNDRDDALASEALTAAELLSASGYSTAAIVSNGNIARELGFAQGFDSYVRINRGRSSEVSAMVLSLLRSGELRQPFLLYIHTVDPHFPYQPPEPFRERWVQGTPPVDVVTWGKAAELRRASERLSESDRRQVRSYYEAEIAANDYEFGRVVEELKRLGLFEPALIVFLSDHGEEFWEHGSWGHGHTLYREVLAIPLIIKWPGQKTGRRVSTVVGLTDLLPTLLEQAEVAIPSFLPGATLRPHGSSESNRADRAVYSLLHLRGRSAASLTTSRYQLIVHRSGAKNGGLEFFSLSDDPHQRNDLSTTKQRLAAQHGMILNRIEANRDVALDAPDAVLDEALVRELRALGYLQ